MVTVQIALSNTRVELMSCICIGMIPHKSKRGTEAMNRLKVYDGVPTPYDKVSNVAHTVLQQFSTCR